MMICSWINITHSLQKGVSVINQLDQSKFEQFLRRILVKVKARDLEIFSDEETQKLMKIFKIDGENLELAIKTAAYILKRLLKFIFMPIDLKTDLEKIKVANEKVDIFLKVWSSETRTMLTDVTGTDSLNVSWQLNAELSSELHKKCKVPKAYINLTTMNSDTDIELTHSDLYSLFLQLEAVQSELDNIL